MLTLNTLELEALYGKDSRALIGLPTLMKMALSGADLTPLGTRLLQRVERYPHDANGLMDLSTILQMKGDRATALAMQAEALKMQQLYRLPAAGGQAKIRLLALMAPGELMANTPLEFLLEGSDVALDMLYIAPHLPLPAALPEHDLVFVAVGESDQNRPLLKHIEALIQAWARPVINAPHRIAALARDEVCTLLKSVPGIAMPVSLRIDKRTLERVGREEQAIADILDDGDFPIIIRPVGSHAGRGLLKLDHPSAVNGYLGAMPENTFYVSRFVDYRGQDGLFRKYRIVLIDGRPFACHMAISAHWMIHYLNAGMSESAAKRDEEAHFMANFDAAFARRHATALRAITERLGLDYYGIDCAETADGKLLIFEVDTSMVVHAMDPVDLFPYKQPHMRKVFDAFRAMLAHAIRRGVP